MLTADAEWYGNPGATSAQLAELRDIAPRETPEALYSLLSHSNGGEGPLPASPLNFVLDDARTIGEFMLSRPYGSTLDGFVIFGGNGAGELLAVDLRSPNSQPVVEIDMVAGPDSARAVAPNFDAFVALIGHRS